MAEGLPESRTGGTARGEEGEQREPFTEDVHGDRIPAWRHSRESRRGGGVTLARQGRPEREGNGRLAGLLSMAVRGLAHRSPTPAPGRGALAGCRRGCAADRRRAHRGQGRQRPEPERVPPRSIPPNSADADCHSLSGPISHTPKRSRSSADTPSRRPSSCGNGRRAKMVPSARPRPTQPRTRKSMPSGRTSFRTCASHPRPTWSAGR